MSIMYIIKNNNEPVTIKYMEYDDTYYVIPINNNKRNRIKVKSIRLYNKNIVNDIYSQEFKYAYQNLASLVITYLLANDDDIDGDGDSNMGLLLGELEKMIADMKETYKGFLKREEYREYLDELTYLHNELKNKLAYRKYQQSVTNIFGNRGR